MAFVLVTEEAEWLLIASVGPPLGQSIWIFSTITARFSKSACFIQFLPRASWDLRKATQLAHGVMMQCQGDITQEVTIVTDGLCARFLWCFGVLCVVWFWWPRKLHVCVLWIATFEFSMLTAQPYLTLMQCGGILVKWLKENCHYLLTLRSFQTCMTFFLPWNTNRDI